MQAYDLIMLIILGMSMIFGAIKGFAWQIASFASIIVSYIVSYRFRFEVAEMIQATPPWNQFLAMLILYVGTSFVIWVGFRLLSSLIDKVRLKEFDRHMGAAFGLAKGGIYCLLVTMFAMSLLGPNQQSAICQSKSGFYIAKVLDKGVGILPKEIHDVVGPYLARLDEKLKDGQNGLPMDSDDGWINGLPSLPGINGGAPAVNQEGQGTGNGWDLGGMLQNAIPGQPSQPAGQPASGGFQQNYAPSNSPANFGTPVQPAYPPPGGFSMPSGYEPNGYDPNNSVPNGYDPNGQFGTQAAQQPAYVLPR